MKTITLPYADYLEMESELKKLRKEKVVEVVDEMDFFGAVEYVAPFSFIRTLERYEYVFKKIGYCGKQKAINELKKINDGNKTEFDKFIKKVKNINKTLKYQLEKKKEENKDLKEELEKKKWFRQT